MPPKTAFVPIAARASARLFVADVVAPGHGRLSASDARLIARWQRNPLNDRLE
jgi:hypothetical protein